MKKWAVLISAVGLAFSVSGCSSDYVMATKDGRMILTDGKPTVDDDTGLISYEISRVIKCKSIVTTFRKSLSVNLSLSAQLLLTLRLPTTSLLRESGYTRTPRVSPTAPPRHPAFLIFYFLFFSPSAMLILLCRGMPDLINKKEAGYAVSPYPTQFS